VLPVIQYCNVFRKYLQSYPPKPYNFAYAVNDHYSGANFGQQEKSDGNNVLGEYRVQLPDG